MPPRKQQTRSASRKRLCFNIVEFDEVTGKPLWRNKKTRVNSESILPTMNDPVFLELVERVRLETEAMNRTQQSSFCCVWRNTAKTTAKKALNNKINRNAKEIGQMFTAKIAEQEILNRNGVNFQPFAPLLPFKHEQPDREPFMSQQSNLYPRDILAEILASGFGDSSSKDSGDFSDFDRGNGMKVESNSPCFQPNNDWDKNTVRLHHLDYDDQDLKQINYGNLNC